MRNLNNKEWKTVCNITGPTCILRYFSGHFCSANFYSSVGVFFFFVEATFVHSNTKQVYFDPLNCPHTHSAYFSLYLVHLQACQYKEHIHVFSITRMLFVLTYLWAGIAQSE